MGVNYKIINASGPSITEYASTNSIGTYTVVYGEGDQIVGEYTYDHTYTATGQEAVQLGVTLDSFHDPSVIFVKILKRTYIQLIF